MVKDAIITVGRQFGSGGREVGHILAQLLKIPVYDREIVTLASQSSHIDEKILENAEERAPGGWGFSMFASYEAPMNDKIFIAQSATIRKLADRGPCVIVGRCADYVLRNNPDRVSVFIHADLPYRIDRIQKRIPEVPLSKVEETLLGVDKKREKYYNYYTHQKWGETKTYHISVNSSKIGIVNCARLIEAFVAMRLNVTNHEK